MKRNITVNLGNLVLSLSDAMDLASPLLIQHQQRVAFAAWQMAKAAQLSAEKQERIFIAALLHDIGAFSLEEKVSLLKAEEADTDEHCRRGELLLNHIPWLAEAARLIRFHHTAWENWGESIEQPLVFESQLLCLADYLERLIQRDRYILHQHEQMIQTVMSQSGTSFHPQIVELFTAVCHREEFWLDLASPRLYPILLNEGPFRKIDISFADITTLSELFRNIIDFRSRFTSTHSSGVAASASMLARIFGLTETEVGLMEVAGNLHDLGKLAIPNSILDKPDTLTKEEMAIIKSHPYYTYFIINTIGGLQQIAEWAAYHHERFNGQGYPFHCSAGELSTGARIMMVADIFTALAEDRPYRKGMSRTGVVEILQQFSERGLLDARIIGYLFENYAEVKTYMSHKQDEARDFYEKQSLHSA